MIVSRTRPRNPLCERCLKLQKIAPAIEALELADSGRLPEFVSLCEACVMIVEEDGGIIKGCNASGYPLDPARYRP